MHKACTRHCTRLGSSWGHGVIMGSSSGVMAQCDLVHHVEPRGDIAAAGCPSSGSGGSKHAAHGHKHALQRRTTTTQDCHHEPHPNKKHRPQAGTEAQDKENKTNRGRPDVGHRCRGRAPVPVAAKGTTDRRNGDTTPTVPRDSPAGRDAKTTRERDSQAAGDKTAGGKQNKGK